MPSIEASHIAAVAVVSSPVDPIENEAPRPVDQFDRLQFDRLQFNGSQPGGPQSHRLDATNTDAAIFAKMSNGVVEGDFYFNGPRVAAVVTSIVTGTCHQTMLALYGTAWTAAEASTQAVSTGVQNASAGVAQVMWSASTWPLRRLAHFLHVA